MRWGAKAVNGLPKSEDSGTFGKSAGIKGVTQPCSDTRRKVPVEHQGSLALFLHRINFHVSLTQHICRMNHDFL